jgi:cyclopropane-fatty-acyl-phospholipid synthase
MTNSLLNVAAHYDISNNMFSAFLTPDMTYSCALFDTSVPNDSNLEAAQYKKLNKIISLAKIKSTDHVLEIGTGWGSFAMEAVKRTGCKVTSLTLSVEQKALAEKRIAQAGLADSITVLLCDYRALKAPKKKFDKVVSIEMLEAVGKEYLDTYFEVIHRVLKADGGIAVFQCITMPETVRDTHSITYHS